MKQYLHSLLFFIPLVASSLLLGSCVGKEPEGCEDVVTVHLKDLDKYVPYTGTETLRFLHNSTDTQTFVGQGMERFFVRSYPGSPQEGCQEDHESIRIRFKNMENNEEVTFTYEYKLNTRGYKYDFTFNDIDLNSIVIDATKNSKIVINGVVYPYVAYFSNSVDTLNYLAYCYPPQTGNIGIVKIKSIDNVLTLIP